MFLRGLLGLLTLIPAVATAGVVELLGAEIARDAASQIKRNTRGVSACVYVDESLSPGFAAASLAASIGASLAGHIGIRDVLEVGLSTLSEAANKGASVGCEVVVVVAFDAPSKNARSRVWVLQPSLSISLHSSARALGEPFSSSIIALQSLPTKAPLDPSKGWRMQQISMGQEPILALLIDSISSSGATSPAMFALTNANAVAYRFDTRAKSSSPFSPPKELYRASLSGLPRATKPSRDQVGVLVLERASCIGDCLQETRYLLARNSSMAGSYRLSLDEGFASPQKLSADDELNQLWPLASQDEQRILFGALEEGTNIFSKKLWWVSHEELVKPTISKSESSLGARFFAVASTIQDKERRVAFIEESEELSMYRSAQMTPLGVFGKFGAQVLLLDLEQDKTPEILTTSSDPAGEGDTITLSAIEEKSLRKLWSSGTLYAPASATAGKTRPLSWVTALAAGDVDGDGSVEIIAALHSAAGSSILIISR